MICYYLNKRKTAIFGCKVQERSADRPAFKTLSLVLVQTPQNCHLWAQWRLMVSFVTIGALFGRISRSAACEQRCHWPMHIKFFQKTRATLRLTAFANSAKAHLQLAEIQPGRDTRAFLERIRCAAATRNAVGGRRFQRFCIDRDHTHAIPWDASRAPFLLLASIFAAGEIPRECFIFREVTTKGFCPNGHLT